MSSVEVSLHVFAISVHICKFDPEANRVSGVPGRISQAARITRHLGAIGIRAVTRSLSDRETVKSFE